MPETQTPEQKAAIDARFQKAGEQAAATHQKERDRLDGKPPAPKPVEKPAEKPRDEQGKFKGEEKPADKPAEKPKTDHIPALRDALAREAAKNKAKDSEIASLRSEFAELKALLTQQAKKPVSPEEQKKAELEQEFVRNRILPELAPVLEASKIILAERQAKEEAERASAEGLAKFESYADILGVPTERRGEAVQKLLSGEIQAPDRDSAFLMALKSVSFSPEQIKATEDAEKASRERAEAEKKAATGLMGRSPPVTEPATDDFQRKIADARKNKDRALENRLIEEEVTRRLKPKFDAGHIDSSTT